jgi:carboxyl-terminal processing protease
MRQIWRASLIAVVLSGLAVAQSAGPAREIFETAFSMIESTYFGYENLDTNALYAKFNARLNELCLTAKPCGFEVGVRVIDELTAAVNDGHTFRLTPLTWTLSDADFAGKTLPSVGLKFAALPDAPALVVTRALQDAVGWNAGVRRGDVVWALDGQPLDQFSSATDALAAIQAREFESKTISLTVSSAGGARRDVRLEPRLNGPWLPTLDVRDGPLGRVGIISFYQFRTGGQVANRVHDLVRQAQAQKVTAMILDVRHSAGGSAYEAMGAAGAFVEPIGMRVQSRHSDYALEYQAGTVKIGERNNERVVNEPVRWDGPLAILTNSTARSAAEYMTFFVQRTGRARVIGEPTAGVLNTATSLMPLADGSEMAVTSARSFAADGTAHPARVTPDVALRDDLGALTNGHDLVLETALKSLEH